MYAIFRAKGKQFRAVPNQTVRIPSLDIEPGERVTFDDVLLMEADGAVQVGTPSLDGAAVSAEVVRHGKGDKIIVYKMKRRKGYRRKQGHRQKFTEIRILGIEAPPAAKRKKKAAAKDKPVEAETVAEAPVEVQAPAEPAVEVEAAPEPAVETPAEAGAAVNITDAARQLAEDHGIDLATVQGSGKDGRILKGDIDKIIKAQGS
jgi:large subunit ribosomal protein L21